MGFLMRRATAICLMLAALSAGCATSYRLDRVIEAGPHDWLQEGGGPGRGNVSSIPLPSRTREASDSADTFDTGGTSDTGESAEGNAAVAPLWEFSLDGPAGRAAPLYVDGAVIFSSTTGLVEAVDMSSGDRIGTFPCKWFIHATPAVAGGSLFVATSGAEPLLLCFDLQGRGVLYETRIPSAHASLCAIDGGVVLTARNGGIARYLTGDSAAVWRHALEDFVTAPPAAADSTVVVAGQNGDINALDLRDGSPLWRLSTGSAFLAGPSIRNGAVAAVNSAGLLCMVDLRSGTSRWSLELGEAVHYGIAWRGDTLAVAMSGGDVLLLRDSDGHELARIRMGELPGAAPLFAGGTLLQLQRRGVLLAIDFASGGTREIARLPGGSETPPLLTPEGIVLVDEQGEAICVRKEG
jgi:eukaryotic-like serine/threonine-protein kinase